MAIAAHIRESMASSSFIRKMFEDGIQLKKQYGADKVYDFSLGNPDTEPPEAVLKAVRDVAAASDKGSHGYMPNAGYPEARAAMARKVGSEQGVSIDGNCAVMAVGAAGALNSVFKAILSPGDEVIVPAPFFAEYTHYARNHGGTLRPIRARADFSLDIPAIAAALSEKTAAVLINSPNNPTGKIYTSNEIRELSEALQAHSLKTGRKPYLIVDEPYRDIVYGGRSVAPVFPFYDASIVVSSFAKNLSLPGERIGYAVVNPACPDVSEVVNAIVFTTRILGYVNAPAFFQHVVTKCWDAKGDYSSYEKRKNALSAILTAAGIEYIEPEGAFYLFCRVPGGGDDGAFCDHLKKYCVLGVPGTGFGYKGYFRLAYCVAESVIAGSSNAFREAVASWKK